MTRSPLYLMSMVLLALGGVALIVMMLHICAEIIGRSFFNQPIVGTLEFVSYYYMVSVVFLPLAITQYNRAMVIVELFLQGLRKRTLSRVDAFVNIYSAIYVGFLAWMSYVAAMRSTAKSEMLPLFDMDLTIWPTRWLLPIGFVGMLIVMLWQIPRLMKAREAETQSPPSTH